MFCIKCGKQIPDGDVPICTECGEGSAATPRENAGAEASGQYNTYQPGTAAENYEVSNKNIIGSADGPTSIYTGKTKSGKKIKIPVIIAAVVAVVALLTVGAVAIFGGGGGGPEKLLSGIAELAEPGDDYTVVSFAENIFKEISALGKEGESSLGIEFLSDYGDDFRADLVLKNSGKGQLTASLSAEADGYELDPTSLYLDKDMIALDLVSAGSWYGVTFKDIDSSLYESGMTEKKGQITDIINQFFEMAQNPSAQTKEIEKVQEELGKILYASIPDGTFEKEKGVLYEGVKCTEYKLDMDGDDLVKFLYNVVDGVSKNKTVKSYIEENLQNLSGDYLSQMFYYIYGYGYGSYFDELEDMDLDELFSEMKDSIQDMYIEGELELAVYYDGKSPMAAELSFEDDYTSVEMKYLVEKGKSETVRTFTFTMDDYGYENKFKIVSTYSGDKKDSEESIRITYSDDWDSYTYRFTLKHSVDGNKTTDTLKYSYEDLTLTVKHVLEGDASDSKFKASFDFEMESEYDTVNIAVDMGYDAAKTDIKKPSANIISDGGMDFIDEDKYYDMMETLEDILYEYEDFFYVLDDIFGSSAPEYSYPPAY